MSTLRANTLKPITSGNSLVLQGDSGGSGVSGPSIDSNGDVDFSQNTNAKVKLPSGGGIYESDGSTEILTESSGTVSLKNTTLNSNNTFPAGHVLQTTFEQQRETNTLTTSFVNYHEFSITLKSASSDIFGILSFSVQLGGASNGYSLELYRKNSSGVTTSDTKVYDPSPSDGTGPLIGYNDSLLYDQHTYNFKDTLSGFSVGNTIYYGIFLRKRSATNNIYIPVAEPGVVNGVFDITLFEVQK